MRVLVDMDGVMADFEGRLLDLFRSKYPDKPYVLLKERKSFRAEDDYEKIEMGLKQKVREICSSKGFYESLAPIKGGLEALNEMERLGVQVFICTSPLSEYENCVLEKHRWIDRYLGRDWVKRIILTKDKTVIRGDFLIDDRPKVFGMDIPSWEHILYTQPYNSAETGRRRLTWDNWKEVLLNNS